MLKIEIIVIFCLFFILSNLSRLALSKDLEKPLFSAMSIAWQKAPKQEIKELGLRWVRLQIRWETLEPARGQYNWAKLDTMCREAVKNNLGITLVIYTGQGWATYCDASLSPLNKKTHCPPKDLSSRWNEEYGYSKSYYDFVYSLVSHMKGVVNYFIIHNEVNSLRFWHGTPEQYLKLRRTAYKAAHDANPDAIVIDNGLASLVWGLAVTDDLLRQGRDKEALDFGNSFFARTRDFYPFRSAEEISKRAEEKRLKEKERAIEFARKIFKEPDFDWFSFHYYENVEALPEAISWIKEQMRKNGYEKPVIISECGYADSAGDLDDPNVQKKAAQDLVKMHLVAFSEGILQLHWLPIQEQFSKESLAATTLKGLFSKNGIIRPAGRAYKALNSFLGDGNFKVEKIDIGGIDVFAINKNSGTIYVAWSARPATLNAASLKKDSFQVYNLFGELLDSSAGSIALDVEPKYIR